MEPKNSEHRIDKHYGRIAIIVVLIAVVIGGPIVASWIQSKGDGKELRAEREYVSKNDTNSVHEKGSDEKKYSDTFSRPRIDTWSFIKEHRSGVEQHQNSPIIQETADNLMEYFRKIADSTIDFERKQGLLNSISKFFTPNASVVIMQDGQETVNGLNTIDKYARSLCILHTNILRFEADSNSSKLITKIKIHEESSDKN